MSGSEIEWEYGSREDEIKFHYWVLGISLVFIVLFGMPSVFSTIPDTLNLHGKLTTPSGSASVGTFEMNFSIYINGSGGSHIYTQSHNITTDNDGIYTTILTGLDGLNFSQQTYLGIQVENDSEMTPRINLTSVPSALAGTGGGGSSFWTQLGTDLYYNDGDVGIGDSTPDGLLDLMATATHTELVIDSPSGTYDSSLEFRNAGTLEWQICMDDSISDELDFVRGGSSCSSTDIMSLTADGLEMGNGRLYFDRSTLWTSSTVSSRYNNQFTISCTTCIITTINHYVNGQPLWVVCNANGGILRDMYPGGNLQLSGDFTCGVGDTLHLIYNDRVLKWVEISRSDN